MINSNRNPKNNSYVKSRQNKMQNYPQSVKQVVNDSEKFANFFQTEVEQIFESYQIERYLDDLKVEVIKEYLEELSAKCQLDSIAIEKLPVIINRKFIQMGKDQPYQLLHEYVLFVNKFIKMLKQFNDKLVNVINNGLLKYCISLADYCITEIDFVNNYERVIRKNQPDIAKEVDDALIELNSFNKFTKSSRLVVYHAVDLVNCFKRLRASINKMFYLILEWIDEEKEYPSNLMEEMKSIESERNHLEENKENLHLSITAQRNRLKSLENQRDFMLKKQLVLRRKLKRLDRSRYVLNQKFNQSTGQILSKEDELSSNETHLKKLNAIKAHPKKHNGSWVKLMMEIQACKSQQLEIEAKLYKAEDSRHAVEKHQHRLDKWQNQLTDRLNSVNKQLDKLIRIKEQLRQQFNEDLKSLELNERELKQLKMRNKDIEFIVSKKNTPEMIRQIRNFGKLHTETKEQSLMEKACDEVSEHIKSPKQWQDLYLNLPIIARGGRSIEERQRDIDNIDRLAARHLHDVQEQTKMCLTKWRAFYHQATIHQLIEGLEKAKLSNIAKPLKHSLDQVTHRYDDDDDDDNESQHQNNNHATSDDPHSP